MQWNDLWYLIRQTSHKIITSVLQWYFYSLDNELPINIIQGLLTVLLGIAILRVGVLFDLP